MLVSTADFCSPGYDLEEAYPELLSCEFVIMSEDLDEPLSLLFSGDFDIKAGDTLKVSNRHQARINFLSL